MSGPGNVGEQYRGDGGGGGLFDTYGGAWLGGGRGAQSGHGGFAHAGGFGGGGGGGRRPWRGGDGPQGHRWEDPRRDGRVQQNTGRGRGRGGRGRGGAQGGGRGGVQGRGRGGGRGGRGAGQGMANKLNTWFSDQHYQNRESGAREQAEGVNFDANLNKVRAEEGPLVKNGLSAVENSQRNRLANSQARQFEAADVKAGAFYGINLEARNVHSLVDRVKRTQPEGTRYNMLLKAVKPENGLVSSEAAKQQLYGAMLSTADPFAFDPDQKDEVPKDDDMVLGSASPHRSADEEMERERRRDAGENPNYEQSSSNYGRKREHYEDA